ncbi:hypothetical protein [Arthrobacter sp. StoSoilB5]|uniref:hypothetical protein n=1 Tax=Arthrobacter sp. StoSoilB5 TaxID=2830992 RepID=UPI001CC65388|nr:hypothetical protein [Arthrobacter sp. StoSoilB5]
MSMSYDHEALWLKAKLFLNRAMDDDKNRSFDEQALWASLALELLGKSALSKISPILIADPTEDGKNILAAAGFGDGDPKFVSVSATTIFIRCKRAFPPFDADKAKRISAGRNEYLHGGGIGFGRNPATNWWQEFWSLATILIDAQDKTIEDLVGGSREDVALTYLAGNKKYMEERLESLLGRARQRYAQKVQGKLSERERKQWKTYLSAGLEHDANEFCPACGNVGLLEGEEIHNVRLDGYYDPESGDISRWGEAEVYSSYFTCEGCQLVLEQYELIELAGLPESFTIQMDESMVLAEEGEYGND